MSPETRRLQSLFKFWTLLFGAGALIFFLLPQYVVKVLNFGTGTSSFLAPVPEGDPLFWLPLAVSLMVTLTFMCSQISKDPLKFRMLVLAVLVSKATSSITYFFFYIRHGYQAPFLWGTLCDGSIFIITYYFFKKALESEIRHEK